MANWALVVPAERFAAERMFLHESLELTGLDDPAPAVGDEVALVAGGDEPVMFALGEVRRSDREDEVADDPAAGGGPAVVEVAYRRRLFDSPLAVDAPGPPGAYPLAADVYAGLAAKAEGQPPAVAKKEWLVGLYLPIEAASPAEAVRAFWTYTLQLGPRELPAFVSPLGDELAMQSFVLGDEANQDPEED
jgi:hypothetical protein